MKRKFYCIVIIITMLIFSGCQNQNIIYQNCHMTVSESAKFCEYCGYNLTQNGQDKTGDEDDEYTFEDYVNDKYSGQTQGDYGYQSTCLAVGCDNLRNNLNFYCSEHACAESNCIREKNYGYSSAYCSYHECSDAGCRNRKKTMGHIAVNINAL